MGSAEAAAGAYRTVRNTRCALERGIETNLGSGLGLVVGPRLIGNRGRRRSGLRLGRGRGGGLGARLGGLLFGGRDAVDLGAGLGNIAVHLLGGSSLLSRFDLRLGLDFGLGRHSLSPLDSIVRGEVRVGNRLDLRNYKLSVTAKLECDAHREKQLTGRLQLLATGADSRLLRSLNQLQHGPNGKLVAAIDSQQDTLKRRVLIQRRIRLLSAARGRKA